MTTSIFEEYYQAQLNLEKEYGSESIVLMMVGSFYEMYGVILPDSSPPLVIGKTDKVKQILGMSMTKKNGNNPHSRTNPYMVGFPDYAIDEHLGTLLKANYCVAIYDQFDAEYTTPTGKKACKKIRKCVRIHTPSTFIDDTKPNAGGLLVFELKTFKSPINGTIMKKVHIAIINPSTGTSFLLEAYDTREDTSRAETELYRIIHSYSPSEIIVCSSSFDHNFGKLYDIPNKKIYFKEIPSVYKKESYQNEFLGKVYEIPSDNLISNIEYLHLEKHANLLPYFIQALQFAYEQDKLIVKRIQVPKFVENKKQLVLNNDSIYQLNLVGDEMSLLKILCQAKTPMGKRLIEESLLNPVCSTRELEKRWVQIEEMIPEYTDWGNYLDGIIDVEKKYRKMVMKKLNPYELADLKESFVNIKKLLKKSIGKFCTQELYDDFVNFYREYSGTFDFEILKKNKLSDIKTNFYLTGVNEKLDELLNNINQGTDILLKIAYEIGQSIEPNKNCVKLESTEKEGWYLSTTKRRFKMIPADLSIKFSFRGREYKVTKESLEVQTLTNTVKIRSAEIKRISNNTITLRETMTTKVLEEYLTTLDYYTERYGNTIVKICQIIAGIDLVYNNAKVAYEYSYTKPQIEKAETSFLSLVGIRHPIIERIRDEEEYITNDIEIGRETNGNLIYGLNMCGKSSLLKSVGCIVTMAQAGMWVPCEKMVFYPFRNLLSKMTIKDNILKGQSTFMVEMLEVKAMLMRADPFTLVLSDELCSSTESTSGHAIVAETLHQLTEKGAKFMFSTHLHELQFIPLLKDDPRIKIFHFKVHIQDNQIVFDRRLEVGGITDLYGLEVAKALGLPTEFMRGAFKIRDNLLRENTNIVSTKQSRYHRDVYMDGCKLCGSQTDLETHHIIPQKDADERGMINKKFHKNSKFNLIVLCEKCHDKMHA